MIKQLEDTLNRWYISKGYYNQTNCYRLDLQLFNQSKALAITDLTGKTDCRIYTFIDAETNKVIKDAILYFEQQLALTKEEFKEVEKLIDDAITSYEGGSFKY